MSKKINKIASFLIFLFVLAVLFYRQKNTQQILSDLEQKQQKSIITPTASPSSDLVFDVGEEQKDSYQFTATVSGQSALELVQSEVELELKEYDFGFMVEAVNGLKADVKHYWALYQNGEYAKTGIADIKLQKGEQLELKYEEIKL